MLKIAIDCRYLGKSGIGAVCEGIIDNLDYQAAKYFLVGDPQRLQKYTQAQIIPDMTEPYSVKGLLKFNKAINKRCDVLLVPNFLIPFGVKIPVFTVMHDLAFLDVPVTTKGWLDRLEKKYLLSRCVRKAVKIACVSNFTRSRCEHYYPRYKDKFFVAYIGLGQAITSFIPKLGKVQRQDNQLVYVGNIKPHKGLATLVEAFKLLPKEQYQLKIIGEKDNFLNGMSTIDLDYAGIEFTGKISNEQLCQAVASAKFLIQPSIYEGFGLTPLEALCLGTKPIISDIPVFQEVYANFPVAYFQVGNAVDLAQKILTVSPTIQVTPEQIQQCYNYTVMARTLWQVITANMQLH